MCILFFASSQYSQFNHGLKVLTRHQEPDFRVYFAGYNDARLDITLTFDGEPRGGIDILTDAMSFES